MKPSHFGVVDCYIDGGAITRSSSYKHYAANEVFISLFNALNSDEAKIFGIERLAYNTGSHAKGMGYWDSSIPAGENAWACFVFRSASSPFCVHIQVSGVDTFGSGTHHATMSSGPQNGVGISFACRHDHHSPWAGTTKNQGRDDKGSPSVWFLTESSIFPRVNSFLGQFQTSSRAMIPLVSANQLTADPLFGAHPTPSPTWAHHARAHFVFNQENFFAAVDVNANGTFSFVYFGKYDSSHESHLERIPYVCYAMNMYEAGGFDGNHLGYLTGPGLVYGHTRTNFNYQGWGFSNGGIADSMTKNVIGLAIDYPSFTFPKSPYGTNADLWSPAPEGFYYLSNIPILAIEGSGSSTGGNDPALKRTEWYLKGEISFIKAVTNITSNALLGSGSYVTMGPAMKNALKLAVPWMPGDPGPGNSSNREGRKFVCYV